MKKSQIKIGNEYAVKVPHIYSRQTKQIVRATVVRPDGKRWIVHREGDEAAKDRTEAVTAQAIIAPWLAYCIDTAHHQALHEDNQRRWQAKYDAEQAALAEHRRPFIDALRGIEIPGETVISSNADLPPIDLGEYLHKTFVDERCSGTTFKFEVFEALAREILELREVAMVEQSGWTGETTTDDGVREVRAILNTRAPIATLDAIEAAAERAERGPTPAGVE
jgi:hypothetical protein